MKTEDRLFLRSMLLGSVIVLSANPALHAATYFWDGGTVNLTGTGNAASNPAANGNWDSGTIKNWDVAPPGSLRVAWSNSFADTAAFAGTARTVTVSGTVQVGTLSVAPTFGTYTFNTGTLSFSNGIIEVNTAGNTTINSALSGSLVYNSTGNTTTIGNAGGIGTITGNNTGLTSFELNAGAETNQLLVSNAGAFGPATSTFKLTKGIAGLSAVAGTTYNAWPTTFAGGILRLRVTGTSTYAGNGTLTANTDFATISGANLAYSGTLNLGSNTLSLAPGLATGAVTISGIVSGSGNLQTKSSGPAGSAGTGVSTLSNTNTYTGATNITTGTLAIGLGGSISNSTVISVASGSKLDITAAGLTLATGQTLVGKGSIIGTLTTSSGSKIAPGNSATTETGITIIKATGTLTATSLTIASGTTFDFEFDTDNDQITISDSNGLVINGGAINLYAADGTTPFSTDGTYTLFNHVGTLGGIGFNALSVANPQSGKRYNFDDTGSAITLTISTLPPSYSISATTHPNGSITGLGNFDLGSTASLIAIPNPGFLFTGWTDDASGTTNPLTITMNADKSVGATFVRDLTDADADGLTAYDELVIYGTNPAVVDSDGDGLSDGLEVNLTKTNPALADSNDDGTNDANADQDGDGLSNLVEISQYGSDPLKADTDSDGLSDGWEANMIKTNPTLSDSDGDALSDGQEVNLTQTSPKLADTDGDGVNDANADQDGDGLSNVMEIAQYGSDPLKADTDGDGLSDGVETNYQGNYFTLIEGSFTQPQATADAANRHGRLASFPIVNNFTRTVTKARKTNQGYLWLGLSDSASEGTWLWSDGSTPSYARWVDGQPDGGDAENYAVLMQGGSQWADAAGGFVAAGYLFERVGIDPLSTDTDGDGIADGAEVNTYQTNPLLEDSDGDGLTDGAEIDTYSTNPKLADTDADSLSDNVELNTHRTNPNSKDSDSDGFDDPFEINTGFSPISATSTPDALSTIRTAVEFRFNAANGVSYRIEGSTDLQNWNTVETGIIGAGGVVTRFYSTENQPKRYFRVKRN
jgi:hypothetical protein